MDLCAIVFKTAKMHDVFERLAPIGYKIDLVCGRSSLPAAVRTFGRQAPSSIWKMMGNAEVLKVAQRYAAAMDARFE